MAAHAAAPPGVKKLAKFYEDATTAFIAFSGPDERYGARPPPQSQGLGEALVPILLPTEQAEPLGEEKDKYVVSTMLSLFLTEARAGRFRRARALDEAHYYILDGGNIPCEGAIGGRFALQPVSRGGGGGVREGEIQGGRAGHRPGAPPRDARARPRLVLPALVLRDL